MTRDRTIVPGVLAYYVGLGVKPVGNEKGHYNQQGRGHNEEWFVVIFRVDEVGLHARRWRKGGNI